MTGQPPELNELMARIRELEFALIESQETLDALRRGTVDALIVSDPAGQPRVYTLETADRPYQFLVERMQEGAVTFAEDGIILYCNPRVSTMLGVPQERIIGRSLEPFLLPEHTEQFRRLLDDAKFSNVRGELTVRQPDFVEIPVQISASPLLQSDIPVVCCVLTDLTEQKRHLREAADLAHRLEAARDRAEQASLAKSRFLAGMSHELRTPLNGILGYARILQMDGGLDPRQEARVGCMVGAGKHLLEMISCILDLSEIEAEHIVLRPVELDLEATARACLDLVRPMAEARALALTLSIARGTVTRLIADPVRLRQILLNLLGNAAKFTGQGMIELGLRTAQDGSAVRIEVADTGPGISADKRQLLFQDFGRIDDEATRTAEGAGLGLALSARLARMMGGRLGYDENPGGGSVFWLELPSPTDAPASAGEPPAVMHLETPAEPAGIGVLHVLIVDDVAMNRDITSAFLHGAGHTTVCVGSGAEAVAAAAGADFDAILMDVRMPGMDGLEATRLIRALTGERSRVPIVGLTAQAFSEQVAACRTAGMDSHLAKPFDPETLLATVMQAVAPRGIRPGS